MNDKINITIYRWAGSYGPFKIRIPCGECSLTTDIVADTIKKELQNIPIEVESHNWLDNWHKPLVRGGWHAPIVLVDDKLISQGVALNRGVLVEAVISAFSKKNPISGNHVFGKENCEFCIKAKQLLIDHNVEFDYHDVVNEPKSLYEMISRAKPLIGAKTPITTPQIWLDGEYVGGFEQLQEKLS